ncbi:MAG: hypothetical protein FWF98_05610 [Dehalococcoidia bacterium]|nr:hypothetical protein [Dehalococcoidia bacterium]
MRTFETMIGAGTRSQKVRVQADNIMKAKMLFEAQYGAGCTQGRSINEVKEAREGSRSRGTDDEMNPIKNIIEYAKVILFFFLLAVACALVQIFG